MELVSVVGIEGIKERTLIPTLSKFRNLQFSLTLTNHISVMKNAMGLKLAGITELGVEINNQFSSDVPSPF